MARINYVTGTEEEVRAKTDEIFNRAKEHPDPDALTALHENIAISGIQHMLAHPDPNCPTVHLMKYLLDRCRQPDATPDEVDAMWEKHQEEYTYESLSAEDSE